jgi:ketosteroid isomerase-like protein
MTHDSVFEGCRCPGERAAAVIVPLLSLLVAASAVGQVLPNPPGATPGTAEAVYEAQVRSELEDVLQEWLNAVHAGDPATVARFYTDEAVIVAPDGEATRGRAGAEAYWARSLQDLTRLDVVIGDVVARNHVAAAGGRFSARLADGRGEVTLQSGHLLLVFERQRGVWMQRLQSAVLDPSPRPGLVAGGGAMGPTGRPPRPPALPQVHWTLGPHMTAIKLAGEVGGDTRGLVGLGAGVELGRLLELRGAVAHQIGGGGEADPIVMYGGELRMFLRSEARVRPYVLGGLSYVAGGLAAGADGWRESLAPVYGAAAAVGLTDALSMHVAARAYLTLAPDRSGRDHWLTASRVHNPSVALGLSFAAGGERAWRDPPVLPEEKLYEQTVEPDLTAVVDAWLAARHVDRGDVIAGTYSPGAWFVSDAGGLARGRDAITEHLRSHRPPAAGDRLVVEDIRAVGNFGLLVARLVRGGDDGGNDVIGSKVARYVSVLERRADRWVIRMHMIAERTEGPHDRPKPLEPDLK